MVLHIVQASVRDKRSIQRAAESSGWLNPALNANKIANLE